jgi:hypothetical protein
MLTQRPDKTSPSTFSVTGASIRTTRLFITFFFAIFFFGYVRTMLINEPLNMYDIMVTAILITIWYGMSLMVS